MILHFALADFRHWVQMSGTLMAMTMIVGCGAPNGNKFHMTYGAVPRPIIYFIALAFHGTVILNSFIDHFNGIHILLN